MPGKFGRYKPQKLSIEEYNKEIEALEAESERRRGSHNRVVPASAKELTLRESLEPTGAAENRNIGRRVQKTEKGYKLSALDQEGGAFYGSLDEVEYAIGRPHVTQPGWTPIT